MTRRSGPAAFVMIAVAALGSHMAAQSVDPAIATPIEQALIEQACSSPPAILINPDKHDECLHGQLNAMRADFGRDLSRLSGVDRKKIDAACEPIRGVQGREGYIGCLTAQLAAVQARWNRGRGAAAETASVAVPLPDERAASTPAPIGGGAPSSSRTWLVITLTLATLGAAAGGLAFAIKARPGAPRVCRVCGTGVEGAGDLCAPCRREAAEALRRAAAERAGKQRATETQEREQRERDEDDRQRQAHEAEEAQRHQQELIRESEDAAQRAEADARRRHAEEAEAQRRVVLLDDDAVFDPHRVLEIPHDANADVIRAAYTKAKAKYDIGEVEGLGDEIKQHYAQKAEAADRAFQMLTGAPELAPATQSH